MKSSTKIHSLTKTIGMENEDLLADVRDARSVVDVTTEA